MVTSPFLLEYCRDNQKAAMLVRVHVGHAVKTQRQSKDGKGGYFLSECRLVNTGQGTKVIAEANRSGYVDLMSTVIAGAQLR